TKAIVATKTKKGTTTAPRRRADLPSQKSRRARSRFSGITPAGFQPRRTQSRSVSRRGGRLGVGLRLALAAGVRTRIAARARTAPLGAALRGAARPRHLSPR